MDWKYLIQYLDHSRVLLFRSNIILDTYKIQFREKVPQREGLDNL